MSDLVSGSAEPGSISALLSLQASKQPDSPCCQIGTQIRSFRAMDEAASSLAAGLIRAGIEPGDRIAVMCATRFELVELLVGASRAGAVVVPLNIFLKGEPLRHQLRDCAPTAILTDAEGLNVILPTVDELPGLKTVVCLDGSTQVHPRVPLMPYAQLAKPGHRVAVEQHDGPFAIVYTSGTTGAAKGCIISHPYAVHWGKTYHDLAGLRPDDVVFTAAPLFHAGGLVPLSMALTAGVPIVIEPRFSASGYLNRARQVGATVIVGVGFVGTALLKQSRGEDDRAHRIRLACISPLCAADQKEFTQRFGISVHAQQYGQSECFPISYRQSNAPTDPDSVGRPAPYLEVCILDDNDREVALGHMGEIALRPTKPDVMFSGYWRNPQATLAVSRTLWHHTGDLGRIDAAGDLVYMGRKNDAIRRRGENVSAFEVENAILGHPGVAEVAVHAIRLPDEGDDMIKACIVAESGTTLDIADLAKHWSTHLPYFAIPRFIEILELLPRNASGRVVKGELSGQSLTPGTIDLEQLGLTPSRAERRHRTSAG